MFIDAQAVLPPGVVPAFASRALDWFCVTFADPLMCSPEPWFRAIVYVECCLQLPFFFVALYGWLLRREWLRLPLIFYGAHVATTLIPIYGALVDAFIAGRLQPPQFHFLAAVYFPYLAVPLFLAYYASARNHLFSTSVEKGGVTGKAHAA